VSNNDQTSNNSRGRVILATADQLSGVTYNADGLVPAIAQCVDTGDILMMAWMNAESLRMTFAEGRMVYYSRSRSELWRKGDTLLFKVDQEGRGACHTGERSCFYRAFGEDE